MINTATIKKKLVILEKRDPTIEELNADSTKHVKSIIHRLKKYSEGNVGSRQKTTVASQMNPKEKGKNTKRFASSETQTDPAVIRNLPAKRKETSPLEEEKISKEKSLDRVSLHTRRRLWVATTYGIVIGIIGYSMQITN
jgi:hypothetical protein